MINLFDNQQLLFNKVSECGACDTFLFDKNKDLQFQYNSQFTEIENIDFSTTPYPVIPTGTDWLIDIPPVPIGTLSPVRSSFLLQNSQRTRLFVITNETSVPLFPGYLIVFDDLSLGIRVIKIRYSGNSNTMRNRIRNTLNATIGFCVETGTTAVNTGTGVRIANMPAGIGFGYWNMNANINTPNPALFQFKHFIDNLVWSPISKKMYWFNEPRYWGDFLNGNTASLYTNDIDLTGLENKVAKVTFDYENRNAFDLRVRVAIKDNGFFLGSATFYDMPANTSGTITHEVILPSNQGGNPFDANGQIEMLFDDNSQFLLRNNDLTFDIDNIKLEVRDRLVKVEKKDCNGVITQINYTEDINNINSLVTIDSTDIQDAIQLTLTDADNNTFNSIFFKLIDNSECRKYLKLEWSNNCYFGGIDYQNLSFTNLIYIRGYFRLKDTNSLENITYINESGVERNVFDILVKQYELNIANYTNIMHELLQSVFIHNILKINNEEYYRGGSGKYGVNSINNGYYTAKITLNKKGTEVINSSCCC